MMKAWICTRYGGPEVLRLVDRPKPAAGPGEVLVRIIATTVSSGDMRMRSLILPKGMTLLGRLALGFNRPRRDVLGTEFAGVIEALGEGVDSYGIGEAVIGFPGAGVGCHAHYRTMKIDGPIASKPPNLTFEEAATLCFGGTTALHFLRKAALASGERILVIGASGAVGSAFLQLARYQGADVTGVTSAGNVALVGGLGAGTVIDYGQQDFHAASERYDVIADCVAASSFARCLPLLRPGGRYLAIAGGIGDILVRPRDGKRSIAGPATESREDVVQLVQLAASGTLRPLVDSVHDFAQMPQAHARVDSGRKRGSVVVRVSGDWAAA